MTIPIVFVDGTGPVQSGLVASLNRSGGTATGVYIFTDTVEQKKPELLHELVPKATVIAGLVKSDKSNR